MKKIGNLLKKYGFYIATGLICVGALTAIFLTPTREGNVKNEANPYAQNELTDAKDLSQVTDENILDEDDLDTTDETTSETQIKEDTAEVTLEEPIVSDTIVNEVAETEEQKTSVEKAPSATQNGVQTAEEKTVPETFESTTASTNTEPFFAEGDTFKWPVEGSVIVPYTDESTKHWFSESLNQTMRTFGICIGANEGTEVKAVAKGTITEIIDDSSTYLEAGMPYVGKLVVMDHGNGYVSLYGFQGGQVNEELVGQVINAGDTIGIVGNPQGAFIGMGNNIYLQVMHNDKVVNPLNYLETASTDEKAEGVDLGFAQ